MICTMCPVMPGRGLWGAGCHGAPHNLQRPLFTSPATNRNSPADYPNCTGHKPHECCNSQNHLSWKTSPWPSSLTTCRVTAPADHSWGNKSGTGSLQDVFVCQTPSQSRHWSLPTSPLCSHSEPWQTPSLAQQGLTAALPSHTTSGITQFCCLGSYHTADMERRTSLQLKNQTMM